MSAARTPTPWPAPLFQGEADEDSNIVYCDDDQPFIVAECVTDAGYTHEAESQFAAFIVRACNSHEALVAALFDLVRYHEDGDYAQHMDERARAATDGNVSALEALCATASAALRAAKGEA